MAIRDYLTGNQTRTRSMESDNPLPIGATMAAVDAEKFDPEVEIGRSGVLNFQGFLQPEEYNLALRPPKSFDIYDQMQLSDPTIRATMLHITTPVRAAEWEVHPASDSEEDIKIAAFVSCCLFDWMETSWDECMVDQLKFLRWGVSVMEEVYEPCTEGWSYRLPGATSETQVAPQPVVKLRKMGLRLPRTIWRWINDEDSELAVIQQRAYFGPEQTYKTVDIPADKCLILVNERTADDWYGVSVLRGAYKPWLMLEAMQRVTSIGYERFFVGTPMARVTQSATPEQRQAILRGLMEVRSGERTAWVYSSADGIDCEGEATTSSNKAVWILQPEHQAPDTIPWIKHLEANIFTNILARFMDLGQRETGARATAEIQDDPFYLSLIAVAKQITEAWNRGTIRRLVDLNFPNVKAYPELVVDKIEPKDTPIIAKAAQSYAAVGFLTPDFQTEQHVRRILRFPDKLLETDDQDGYSDAGADAVPTTAQVKEKYPSPLSIAQEGVDLQKAALDTSGGAGLPGAGSSSAIPGGQGHGPPQGAPPQPQSGQQAVRRVDVRQALRGARLPVADPGVSDSGDGTSLSDQDYREIMAAGGGVVQRMLAESKAAEDARAIFNLRAKDLGRFTRALIGAGVGQDQAELAAARFGLHLESVARNALFTLSDDESWEDVQDKVEQSAAMWLLTLIRNMQ